MEGWRVGGLEGRRVGGLELRGGGWGWRVGHIWDGAVPWMAREKLDLQ